MWVGARASCSLHGLASIIRILNWSQDELIGSIRWTDPIQYFGSAIIFLILKLQGAPNFCCDHGTAGVTTQNWGHSKNWGHPQNWGRSLCSGKYWNCDNNGNVKQCCRLTRRLATANNMSIRSGITNFCSPEASSECWVWKIWGRFLKLQDHVRPLEHASSIYELLCRMWSFEVKRCGMWATGRRYDSKKWECWVKQYEHVGQLGSLTVTGIHRVLTASYYW